MIEIKHSTYKGNGIIEIWRDGNKAISFGKNKARAIVEAMRDDAARFEIETISGHAQADREQLTKAGEAADRQKFNEAYKGQHAPSTGFDRNIPDEFDQMIEDEMGRKAGVVK
jgi:hypothetical protein